MAYSSSAVHSQNGPMTEPHENAPANGSSAQYQPAADDHLSKIDELKDRFDRSWLQMKSLLKAVRAPIPTQTGDGSQLPQAAPERTVPGDIHVILRDLYKMGIKDVHELCRVFKAASLENPLDDKKYLMEYMIQAASKLDADLVQTEVTDSFLETLWNDLQHPASTLLGSKYQYRQPDGSNNNFEMPHVGAAGMPYARTVSPNTMRSGAMPDPGVLFDALMARKDPAGTPHPNKISSILFYLASIIIHDLFRTSRTDYNTSDTSSYLDLAPLYGSNWAEQKRMRTMKDGKIHPDCFSETRLVTFPPGVGALLIMFNRYHNYIATELAAINENGRFTENPQNPLVERYGEKINRRDDDIFQTARLVTCGLYINIILIDYVRTILNLNRTDENWQLNPRVEIAGKPAVATGNQVSAEFNLVYRWHATISHRDDLWTQALFKEMFPDVTPEEISTPAGLGKLLGKLGKMEAELTAINPEQRAFPALASEKLERIKEGPYQGSYNDNDLAAILTASVEDCANAFGPQQVPTVLKAIEVLGIKQSRYWHCATLNEFRKHFALEPHHTFDSITGNKEVAEALKHLYNTPDEVELYPGLVVEDAKTPMKPGSGLCPSYTVSRAVLSDAVALVRSDRFYTKDYTPANLTNWGFQEASSDLSIDNGCVMYKLFLRALPNNFNPASVYVHYPFTVPNCRDGMKDILQSLGKAHLYNFDQPKPIVQPQAVFSYNAAKQILGDQQTFQVTWEPAMEFLMGSQARNFCLAGDGPANAASRTLMGNAIYLGAGPQASRAIPSGHEKWYAAVRDYYEYITTKLIREKTYKLGSLNELDIIRDVGNLAHVHFCADMFSLPLKTEDFKCGMFSEQQLYMLMAGIFISIFFDVDPPKSFPLRQQAQSATKALGEMMQLQVKCVKETGAFAQWFIERIRPVAKPLQDYGIHMIRQLVKEDPDDENLVWGNIMGTMGGMVANQGQLFGQALDYLFTEGKEHWPEIHRLAKANTQEADDKLLHYVLEATRLHGETGVLRWVEKDVTVVDKTDVLGSVTHNFKKGDKIMVCLKAAGRDPTAFPNPDKVNLNRPIDSYIQFGYGPHQCLGLPMTRVALTTMLKVIGRLDNLRPSKVSVGSVTKDSAVAKVVKEFVPGDLNTLPESWHYHAFLTESWNMFFPFPTTLKVNYDGQPPMVHES